MNGKADQGPGAGGAAEREADAKHLDRILQSLIDTMPVGVVIAEAGTGRIIASNRAAEAIVGVPITGTARGPAGGYVLLTPDGQPFPPSELPLARALARGEVVEDVEIRIRSDTGAETIVLASAAPVRGASEKITSAIALFRDVPEHKQDEDALRTAAQLLTALLEHAPTPIFVVSTDGRYELVNRAWEELFHLRHEQVIGRLIEDVLPAETARQFWKIIRRVVELAVPQAVEGFVDVPEGHRYYYTVEFPLRDATGKTESVGGIAIDITERKRAEEALRFLASIVESSDDAIIGKTLDGIIVSWNSGAERMYGYSAEEVKGRSISLLILPERPDELPRILERLRRGERIDHYETVRVRKDGQRIYVSLTISPIQDPEGRVIGASTIARDITERRRAEEVLRETSETLQAMFQASPLPIVALDPDGNIQLWNPAAERMFGWTAQEVLGRPYPLVPEDRQEEFRALLRAALQSKSLIGLEVIRQRKDGSRVYVSLSTAPLRDSRGEFRGVIGVLTDIAERKRAEQRQATQFAVTRVLAEFATVGDPTPNLLQAICEGLGWDLGEMWRVDPVSHLPRRSGTWHVPSLDAAEFEAISHETTFPPGTGWIGQVWDTVQPMWIADVAADPRFLRASAAARIGLRAAFAFPIRDGGKIVGVMAFFSRDTRPPDEDLLQTMADIGRQIGQFFQRRRAEEELEVARERLLQAEVEKKRFYREVIRAVTHGKLHLVDAAEIPTEGRLALATSLEDLTDYSALRQRVREIAVDAGMPPEVTGDLVLAAGEAITNATKHAVRGQLTIYVTPDRVIVRVSDRGPGIRPEDLPATVLLPGFSTKVSLGMGHTIMLQLSDSVWLATGPEGTVVQMEKWIHPEEHPEPPLLATWERL
ncbi:MAG: PAS domain S-box protein [Armatimonadetes bacterium]|nr:PAS domain S-box protein [Armatimonadota bacterium]